MICVPLAISPVLAAAEYQARYQWEIEADGKAVVWRTKGMGVTERLTLLSLLSHPQSRITVLPSKWSKEVTIRVTQLSQRASIEPAVCRC